MRQLIGSFVEVHVNVPLSICEKRDVKGHYKKARAGQIQNFTAIDSPYEPPINPEIECRTAEETIFTSTSKVLAKLQELGYICFRTV